MLRPTWLTIPVVVVSGRLNGLPIATTGSPTWASEEFASAIGCSSEAGTSTWITATSVDGSVPSTLARALRPSWNLTVTLVAPETTCSSVRMLPLRVVDDTGAFTLGLLRAAATAAERIDPTAAALLGDPDVDDAGAGVAVDLVHGQALARAERRSESRMRPGGWTTVVVVTEWLLAPVAITTAIAPPAMAPATIGRILFKELMIGFSCIDTRRGS